MEERYVYKDGKKLKYGYTTGSCAAAASKAAAIMALTQKHINRIKIDTPKGWALDLDVCDAKIQGELVATCKIKKDAGDDPDITHGLMVGSRVKLIKDREQIHIEGGEGVGRVTRKGLYVPVGRPAINPTPLKMIEESVKSVLPEGYGADIEIFVPKGEEVAKKTFNPRLGIIGGISILGTTGIVEPMSENAFKESLALELKMMVEKTGTKRVILAPGNYGVKYSKELYGLRDEIIIKTSNFMGFMLNKCIEHGIEEVLVIGHIGKLIKVSSGIFDTHSRVADARKETMIANLALLGTDVDKLKEVEDCVTTEGMIEILSTNHDVYDILANKAEDRIRIFTYDDLKVGVSMFSMDKGILGEGKSFKSLLEVFKNDN